MVIAFALLAIAVTLELIVNYHWPVRVRKTIAVLAVCLFTISSSALIWLHLSIGSALLAAVSLYSVLNLCRAVLGSADEQYTRRSVTTTALWLGSVQVAATYYLISTYLWQMSWQTITYILIGLQVLLAAVVYVSMRRQLRTTTLPIVDDIADSQLPTVTVAVPVRNEEQQLQACLTSILASNYPKLEVIAFDDNSYDRTPEIIRGFAHAGVQFIRSQPHKSGWLAKNQAYDSLVQAANGQYIVFCGADVRLGVRTIRKMVAVAQGKQKRMISIMPVTPEVTTVPWLQAMRYYWEMAPPRRLFNRPPVLSSCWLIERKALKRYGGFAAVKQSIVPEAYLAKQAVLDADGYSFVRSNDELAITSHKSLDQQRATALLRRYPQAHRRPELVLVYTLAQSLLVITPLVVIGGLLTRQLSWIALVPVVLAVGVHGTAFARLLRPVLPAVASWRALMVFLPAVAADIWYLNQSMVIYEFATVTWKERNITKTVMRRH